jgi:hypothetical protein
VTERHLGGWLMFGGTCKATLVGAVVAMCVLGPRMAISKDDLDRSDKEAVILFKQIISDERAYYKECVISDEWLAHPIYAYSVRNYIKYPIRGDVSPPHRTTMPKDIIGRGAGAEGLICSEKEQMERKDAALGASTYSGNSTFRDKQIVASTNTSRREFSYPIFDIDYRTAFVVRDNSRRIWIKTENNKYPSFGDGETAVFIYRKKHGRWKLIGHDEYASYH